MENIEPQVPVLRDPRRHVSADRGLQQNPNPQRLRETYFMWEHATNDSRVINYFSGNPHQAGAAARVPHELPVPRWPHVGEFGHIINYNIRVQQLPTQDLPRPRQPPIQRPSVEKKQLQIVEEDVDR